MKVEIAFDLSANGLGSWFTLDDTTKGLLDGATYLLAGDVFVDVTSDVRAVQVKRGRSQVLDKFTAGAANITLDNRDRYYDPLYAPTTATRTNLVTNPSFEVDTTGWIAQNDATLSKTTSDSLYGTACALVTLGTAGTSGLSSGGFNTYGVTAGNSYTFSVYVKIPSDQVSQSLRVYLVWSTGASVSSSDIVVTSAAGWTRLLVTGTAPAGASAATFRVRRDGTGSVGTYLVDAILFEQSSTLNPYFDGTISDPTIRYTSRAWTGTANASTSTITYYVDGTGSPYYGSVVPRKSVRISHLDFPLFTGAVEDWNLDYSTSRDSTAEASCADGFTILANQGIPAGTQTSEVTGTRIGAILDDVGWPATQRAISTGQATLDADYVEQDENALAYLQKVELSEGPAALFMGKSGLLTFRDRSYMQAGTAAVTFGTGGVPFTGIAVQYGVETMVNSASVTWTSGSAVAGTATANDLTAQGTYGVMDKTYATLLSSSTDAQALADWIVGNGAQPQYQIDSITVNLGGITSAQRTQVLGLELGDLCTVTWTPNGVGSAISQSVNIDAIEHTATPARHDVTFTMSPALSAFVLDSDSYGVLDTSKLGF